MKVDGNNLRPGNVIRHRNALWSVVKISHVKPGKGGAFAQVELRGVLDGGKLNERFRSAESIERVHTEDKPMQILFTTSDTMTLMDPESYEQTELPTAMLGRAAALLQDGMTLSVTYVEGDPVDAAMPAQVVVEVVETEPVVKGQTTHNSFKTATITGGARVSVAPFIGVGDKIVLDVAEMTYVQRAKAS